MQDCVEKEKVDTHCNYEANKDFVDEVRLLYKWWLTRKSDKEFDNDDEDIACSPYGEMIANEFVYNIIKNAYPDKF